MLDYIKKNKKTYGLISLGIVVGLVLLIVGIFIKNKDDYEKARGGKIIDVLSITPRFIRKKNRPTKTVYDYILKCEYYYRTKEEADKNMEKTHRATKIFKEKGKSSRIMYNIGQSINIYYKINDHTQAKITGFDPDKILKIILIILGSIMLIGSSGFGIYKIKRGNSKVGNYEPNLDPVI